ncbi:MAG: subclass B3 metallo-beta-lactamase [Sphingobacteriales bacterium]|nr:MAG: subclass B3 metallo-beta-lactamase [Sphingobacteriales bacterium]
MFKVLAFASAFFCCATWSHQATAQVKEPDFGNVEWKKPYKPFRIVGNLYYVGTYELASYLITTPEGHILINTGLASSADAIAKNIVSLGFTVADIKILLTNQAHFDHLGGMAGMYRMCGAKMMADAADVDVIQDGGDSDFLYGGKGAMFEPVNVERALKDGDKITLGDMELTMLHHPGHTKGSCSYAFTVKDEKRNYDVLIANMPKMLPEVELPTMPTYPEVGKDFEYTYGVMPGLKFDIWLAAHASQFDLHRKHKPGDKYNPDAFIDRKGYDASIKKLQKEYLTKKAGK